MTTASQRGKRNRTHGHETERMVVRYLREQGFPDAATTRSRLGHDGFRQPGDISFTPGVCLEVKGFMDGGSRWPSWRAQVLEEAQGRVAVVVRRTRGVPDVGAWECELPAFGDLLQAPDSARAMWCKRTGMWWARLPFGEVVALLKDDR